ncbi:calcineurin phosphoesterase [Lysobacter aestuarii]|uniref:Calcineurin phosphoesterase n=2 Tax=Marilutibacter aestuarii TaxID=1706195 RepID=A0A508A631_9GAMM|nr:calcineurin phosphoesterase [Lysobacter aestuarii]
MPGQVRAAPACPGGVVYQDDDRDGRHDPGEPGVAGVRVSDGVDIVETGDDGRYRLAARADRPRFIVKPPGYRVPDAANGLPDFWRAPDAMGAGCGDFALWSDDARRGDASFAIRIIADPQPKSAVDVDYYARDIVEPILAASGTGDAVADLGLSLGDIVNDDLSLYPAMIAQTARLGVPWLHVAGNHDLDAGAVDDAASLATFRHHFGPDTFAWETPQASFLLFDDVVHMPGGSPSYVGGLREDQFRFIEAYLATARRDRLLVLGVHIPFFDTGKGRESFRHEDRERLFRLLEPFPRVLLLSGHGHVQQHAWHGPSTGWHGRQPLHEYNVGAACGAFWSGVADAEGIPDATMSDGTPNGHARMDVDARGDYRLAWLPARDASGEQAGMSLHAPRVLRRGAWPGFAVYANVYMGDADSRVEYRIDAGEWKPMARVVQADPRVLATNLADDAAEALRAYDRAPEAKPSQHLWRGSLPTDLATGEHRIEVRTHDRWRGELRAATAYTLVEREAGVE